MLNGKLKTMMAGLGVAGAIALPAYLLVFRPWHLRWGTTNDETTRPLPVGISTGATCPLATAVSFQALPFLRLTPRRLYLSTTPDSGCSSTSVRKRIACSDKPPSSLSVASSSGSG